MMNNPMLQTMIDRIKANPNIAGNPQALAYIEVLESGDSKRGQELANNLLNTYGMTREDALAQAKQFFRFS